MTVDVEELYSKQISRLDNADQLRLLVLLAEGLQAAPPKSLHSLLELEGLGVEIWQDGGKQPMSANQYINELRNEWGHRA